MIINKKKLICGLVLILVSVLISLALSSSELFMSINLLLRLGIVAIIYAIAILGVTFLFIGLNIASELEKLRQERFNLKMENINDKK